MGQNKIAAGQVMLLIGIVSGLFFFFRGSPLVLLCLALIIFGIVLILMGRPEKERELIQSQKSYGSQLSYYATFREWKEEPLKRNCPRCDGIGTLEHRLVDEIEPLNSSWEREHSTTYTTCKNCDLRVKTGQTTDRRIYEPYIPD